MRWLRVALWSSASSACGFGASVHVDATSTPPIDGVIAPRDGDPVVDGVVPDAVPDAPNVMACIQPPATVLAWWPGDGNANDVTGNYNGTLADNARADQAGEVNTAFQFDGNNDQVTIAAGPSSSEFTIEAWVALATGSGYQTIYGGIASGFWLYANRLNWWQGQDRLYTPGGVVPNEWHHVALTYDGAKLVGYVDGVSVGSANYASAKLPISGGIGGHDGNEFVSGKIDEVTIYDRALLQSEVLAIATAGTHGKCHP